MSGASGQNQTYGVPRGIVGLMGPVVKPDPGTLPLRGDLAHIALAGKHLAAHYVIPRTRCIGNAEAHFLLVPREGAEIAFIQAQGKTVEVLDYEGEWVWACNGPDGPSGYCKMSALAPETTGG